MGTNNVIEKYNKTGYNLLKNESSCDNKHSSSTIVLHNTHTVVFMSAYF